MTYIDRLNRFNAWLESNALPCHSQLMYFKLLNVFNRAGWPETVQVDNRHMEMMLDGLSLPAIIRAREKLITAGFILYHKGKKGSPNRYSLLNGPAIQLTYVTLSVTDSVTESVTDSVTESVTHIKTETETKTEKETPIAPIGGAPRTEGHADHAVVSFEDYRQAFIEECPSLPKPNPCSQWSSARRRALRANGAGLDRFRAVCRRVEASDFLTGRDGKWAGCSLDWLLKPANWQKVNEGNYDNRRPPYGPTSTPKSYDIDEMQNMSSLNLVDNL